jgi:hypothetical protein
MLAPKPALAGTVYGLGKPHPVKVVHDGHGRWTLDDGHGGAESSLAWARSALEPARYANLVNAAGRVVGRDREGGREVLAVEIDELRRAGGPTLLAWVDEATGGILRLERPGDPAPLVLVLDLHEEG